MIGAEDLPELIRRHLPSVWALELLLLMKRRTDRDWTCKALSDELRATVHIVTSCMSEFERLGLAARDGEICRYAPASPLLAAFGEALEAEYRERPVAIISLIAAPPDRLKQLADAFRFKSGQRL